MAIKPQPNLENEALKGLAHWEHGLKNGNLNFRILSCKILGEDQVINHKMTDCVHRSTLPKNVQEEQLLSK